MRLDPEHIAKLSRAISTAHDGGRHVDLDVEYLNNSLARLSLWEGGLLIDTLMRAAQSRKLNKAQRALLALFVHPHDNEEGCHDN